MKEKNKKRINIKDTLIGIICSLIFVGIFSGVFMHGFLNMVQGMYVSIGSCIIGVIFFIIMEVFKYG